MAFRKTILILVVSLLAQGCVSEADEATRQEDAIISFYMPRTTEYKYHYKYSGFGSGKRDSLFTLEFRGTDPNRRSTDGYSPIYQSTIESQDKQPLDIELYVSDSVIVEYGRNSATRAERFIPLQGKINKGKTWNAAQGYKAAESLEISFIAEVMEHYDQLVVADSIIYKDVWQVNYEVTSADAKGVTPIKEYTKGARRVIYFARGIGKVLELAFGPDSRNSQPQWKNELVRVERR